ncbi:MAG: NADH-quinone oxidoreductase subunit F [Betaproteobacteria bacterium HGW-Betaproteobacteria-11]|nr:MAG: NADH-quinone oxidoreductase subunit F [Betaproteobacteria bacterium HGW-Betaproteobacteria-11]
MNAISQPLRRRHHGLVAATRTELRALLGEGRLVREQLIEYLHVIQDTQGSLPQRLLAALAHELRVSLAEVFEVASFYHHFEVAKSGEEAPPRLIVRVCDSLACALAGSTALAAEIERLADSSVCVERVSCVGHCESAPVVVVGQHPVTRATAEQVLAKVPAGMQSAGARKTAAVKPAAQTLTAYRAAGGYGVYATCLRGEKSREETIAELEHSGLRGLGGAGFPAGRKWRLVAAQPAPRYLAINIDEGEPGTFKDRYHLERTPHAFLEGALIAAWAVGIEKIWIYLRDEYAGCQQLLDDELAALRDAFPAAPPIELRRGAGAYICGEESAMIESIEGKRGLPRLRPPYLAEVGLFGRPTLEHNLETLHWVPEILHRGADWFAAQGRHGRKGLRSFSVSGRVQRPGVHLAPAGITLNELLAEYCGGMAPGHTLYGYFPGGASGGILPAHLADLPLDFDTLQEYGCFIGSAAIIVFSQADRARDLALNAMRFFVRESCGQCTPCRVGTVRAAQLMTAATWDAATLEELSRLMEETSICGLGQAAPNPLRSVLRYFPAEVSR